jgi:antitoxin VapB
MATQLHTRIFKNGNSQAVRIPHALRLDADEVTIERTADGGLLISPLPATVPRRGDALLAALRVFDDDFVAALEAGRAGQAPVQERESLD